MIVTFTPNPAIDLTIDTQHLTYGGTTVVDGAVVRAGGKGLNVARVLAQAGYRTHAVAPIGAADAAWFAADLDGLPHTLVACPAPTRRSYAIHESGPGVTSIINERGTPHTDAQWDRLLAALAGVTDEADCLALCGSVPPGAPDDLVARVVNLAKGRGLPVVVDTSGDRLVDAARSGATLLKPNRDELAAVIGDSGAVAGAKALQRLGAQIVLVSMGEDGLIVVPRTGNPVRARLRTPLRGNPTGAGDAAVAGATSLLADSERRAGLLRGDTAATQELAMRAACWSAAAVLMPRAGEIHPDYRTFERDLEVTVLGETE